MRVGEGRCGRVDTGATCSPGRELGVPPAEGSQDRRRDADRLAEELGDLPLALEQAGAPQAESDMPVQDYLTLFAKQAGQLLAENPPAGYHLPVAAAWSVSMAKVGEAMPMALEVLRRCAFFGPEPFSRDLLTYGKFVLDPPLRELLASPIQFTAGPSGSWGVTHSPTGEGPAAAQQ